MLTKTTNLSDTMAVGNLSAEFWCDVNATPENFEKKLSDGDYKIIALYVEKVIRDDGLGISDALKSKIVSYMRFHFKKDYIDQFFDDIEKELAEAFLLKIYNIVNHGKLKKVDLKMFNKCNILKQGRGDQDKIKVLTGFRDDHIELALNYLRVMNAYMRGSGIKFTPQEEKQVNIIMTRVIEKAKEMAEKEVETLKRKLKTIQSLF